jgi:hypothetical protein
MGAPQLALKLRRHELAGAVFINPHRGRNLRANPVQINPINPVKKPWIVQRAVQRIPPDKALTLIKGPELKALVAAFIKCRVVAASKSTP